MNVNKNWIILILVAIIAAIFLFKCNGKPVPKPETIPTKIQAQEVTKFIDSLKPVVDSLQQALKKRDSKISEISQARLLAQADANHWRSIAKSLDTTGHNTVDNDYYTQQQVIHELVVKGETSDSLCNDNIDSLNEQIVDYKRTDSLKNQLYFDLRKAFDKSIEQQNILQGYSKKLETKIKWTKAGKFLWKGAAIVGGLFILKTALK
jgi:hypothetical protein